MKRAATGFRPDIQGMRALAVAAVALNHAHIRGFSGGYVGVDVFFVISGFLITGWLIRRTDRDGKVPFGEFYAARARRILPAAALTIIATAIATKYLVNYVRGVQVDHDAIWAAFFAANIRFARLGTDYFQQSQPPSPLQHYWSLAVEEQFYLVWPALIAVLLVVASARRRILIGATCAAIAASLAWSVISTSSSPAGAYFSSPARAWELGIGALLALAWTTVDRIPDAVRTALGWAGLAAVVVAVTAYTAETPFPGYAALLPVLGAAALIAANGRGPGRILAVRPLTYTGDISYSFYLWHWPFLVIAAEHAGRNLSSKENLMLLALAYAVASVTYRLFENPLRHARAFNRASWRALTLWPVTVGVVVALALVAISSAPSTSNAAVGAAPTVVARTTGDPLVAQVEAALKPAHLAQKINPAKLTPSVSELQSDHFNLQNCTAGDGNATSSPICHWGDTSGTKTMVVIGDSHAEMWMLPLSYFAAANGWQLIPLVKPGCISTYWTGADGATAACKGWISWVKSEVSQLSPDAIVFTSYYQQDVKGMGIAIKTLAKATPKLAVIQDSPKLPVDPTDCLLKSGATFGSCTFAPWWRATAGDATVQKDAKAAHAAWVPTQQWFCANGKCPMVIGSTIAYIDHAHISQEYARELKTLLSSELVTALR